MYTMLKKINEGLKPETEKFVKSLINIQSPTLGETHAAEFIYTTMKSLGFDKTIIDEAGNCVGVILGRELSPVILLNSHMDVFQNPNNADLETDTNENIIVGPGASDCKSGIAAQIFSAHLLRKSLLPLRGSIVVATTVAEANGLSLGMKTLLNSTLPKLGLNPNFAILGEPTNLGIYYGHDGWLEMVISIEGTNSFHVDDTAKLLFSNLTMNEGPISKNDFDLEHLRVLRPLFETLQGVRKATIPVVRRLSYGQNETIALNEMKNILNSSPVSSGNVAVSVEVKNVYTKLRAGQKVLTKHCVKAWETDPFSPLMTRARQCLEAAGLTVKSGKWTLPKLGMGTAGSVLVNEYCIPTIGYGPGDETVAHSPNEYVEKEKLFTAVLGTAAIVHGLVGYPVCGWTLDEI